MHYEEEKIKKTVSEVHSYLVKYQFEIWYVRSLLYVEHKIASATAFANNNFQQLRATYMSV